MGPDNGDLDQLLPICGHDRLLRLRPPRRGEAADTWEELFCELRENTV